MGVVTVAALLLRDFGFIRISLPQRTSLVPRNIDRRGPKVAAFNFGTQLGLGFRTHLTTSSPYALGVMLVLLAGVVEGLVAGVAFAAGRWLMTIVRYLNSDHDAWDRALSSTADSLAVACSLLTALGLTAMLLSLK